MTTALSRGIRKGVRTLGQVIAGGALTALVTAVAGGLPPATQGVVMGAWVALVAFLQNWGETTGKIPTLLPAPGLITKAPGKLVTKTVGTVTDSVGTAVGTTGAVVEAVVEPTGEVVGEVLDTAGDVVGGVTGLLGKEDDDEASH